MIKKELEAFAREAAKSLKTEKDLKDFRSMLTKVTKSKAQIKRTGIILFIDFVARCTVKLWILRKSEFAFLMGGDDDVSTQPNHFS